MALALLAVLLARGESQSTPIKHVVVLYLENRGFDHVLGFSGQRLGVDGLSGRESNPLSLSDPSLGRLQVTPGAPYVATMDPNHGMPAYTLKIFGNQSFNETSANGTCMNDCSATMEGFLPVGFDGEGYKHIDDNKTEARFVMQVSSPQLHSQCHSDHDGWLTAAFAAGLRAGPAAGHHGAGRELRGGQQHPNLSQFSYRGATLSCGGEQHAYLP